MSDTFSTAGEVVTAAPPTDVPESAVRDGVDEASHSTVPNGDAETANRIQQKYEAERNKRVRADGLAQYVEPGKSEHFRHFQDDPWLDHSTEADTPPLENGARCQFLILGAGYGGLLFAVRLIQAGCDVNDIRMVDAAGGFGGTWYWNRYPGLKCDVESYIYMPLLEETGYMPKDKYASGHELREYANMIADKWSLTDKALFQTKISHSTWDEDEKEWVITMTRAHPRKTSTELTIRSSFVMCASGLLNAPKLPRFPGIDQFQGVSFHTSRWDYHCTGGSPDDPSLTQLQDKRVGIIGTGATAVQAVPHLAKWAKHLYVFQRTPPSIDARDNHPTDSAWWQRETQGRQGWQQERMANFNAFLANAPRPDIDMVSDGWTRMPAFSGLIGGPKAVSMQDIPEHVASLYALDLPRAQRVRARVDDVVQNRATAERLKAWHPAWCKRPCFSDDYLPTFNLPHVTLVDTDGHGVERVTPKGLVANSIEHELDVLIFSTGFRAPGIGSPASRADMSVIGRGGITLDEKFQNGLATLHGVVSRDFPNFFFPGPYQSGAGANQMAVLDVLTRHVAYIVAQAVKQSDKKQKEKVTIEPTTEAEEAWSMRILGGAASFAGLIGCTPGYITQEGEIDRPVPMEQRMKNARRSIWGLGLPDYTRVLGEWRGREDLEGLEVRDA